MTEGIELSVIQPTANPPPENSTRNLDSSEEQQKLSNNSSTEESASLISIEKTKNENPEFFMPKLWTGNTFTFCYINGYPLFTIGPHCIFQ